MKSVIFQQIYGKPRRHRWTIFAFVAPAFGILIVIFGISFAFSIWLSFHRFLLTRPKLGITFVGLSNYFSLLWQDQVFQAAVKNTLLFTLGVVSLELFFGLLLALLLSFRTNRSTAALRIVFLLPLMITPVVVGLIWRYMLHSELGVINYILMTLGIVKSPVAWLTNSSLAMPSIMVADAWKYTPFVMLCLLAGIKALPQEIYEAARIDGASPWKSFIHITLPLIQPTIKVVLLFRTMDAFRIFDLVFMLTRGGPGTITETVSMHNYEVLANYFRVGYASAMSVMILAMALTICLTYILILRTKWEA